jgi:hypothetical protein
LAYQYTVKPFESASTGPMLVLIFSSMAGPDGIIPEPELDIPEPELDIPESELGMALAPLPVLGEVLLAQAASNRAGMARTAGAHLR